MMEAAASTAPGRRSAPGAGNRAGMPLPPWRDWGGSGPLLHLAHANGFPPGTYRRLAEVLAGRHHVVSMAARPLWPDAPPEETADWRRLADDLRRELRRRDLAGCLAVGHSLGAAMSLLAAAADPGLFRAVVAVDPLLLTGTKARLWALSKRLGLSRRFRIVSGARTRREVWPDRATARAVYARKHIFRNWDPAVLDDYLECGMVDESPGEGVRLAYPREWEARVFETAPHDLWPRLRRIAVPTLFVRGEHSDSFTAGAARRIARDVPAARVVVVPGTTHFIPMERPAELGRIVLDFLQQATDQGGQP